MPEAVALISFAAGVFGIALVPGPAAAFCLAAGLESRRGLSFAAAGGVALGKAVHLSIALAGAVSVAQLHAGFRAVMLLVAALVMVVQGLRRWRRPAAADDVRLVIATSSRLAQGFAISAINPQSLASAIAVVPLFVSESTSTVGALSMLLGGSVAAFAAYVIYEAVAVLAVRRLTWRLQLRLVGATYLVAATGLGLAALI